MLDSGKTTFTEFEDKNGNRVQYHGCSREDLETAKKFYKGWEYLGPGTQIWVDGVKQSGKEKYHFFLKPKKTMEEFAFVDLKGVSTPEL